MENRIFKYVLEPERRQMIYMHPDAKPIYVAAQNNELCMWVQVPSDPLRRIAPRVFVVVTTGDYFNAEGKTYIGSAILGKQDKEWFVAHVYEQSNGFADPIDQRSAEDFKQLRAEVLTD